MGGFVSDLFLHGHLVLGTAFWSKWPLSSVRTWLEIKLRSDPADFG